MKRRPPTYSDDIAKLPHMAALILVLLTVIAVLLPTLLFTSTETLERTASYNASAKTFNNLPESTRKICEPFLDVALDENSQIPLKAPPRSFQENLSLTLPYTIMCIPVLVTLFTFMFYCSIKNQEYYLADLPFRTVCGWLTFFIILPVGWPFLLISRLRMRHEDRPAANSNNPPFHRPRLKLPSISPGSFYLQAHPPKKLNLKIPKNLYNYLSSC